MMDGIAALAFPDTCGSEEHRISVCQDDAIHRVWLLFSGIRSIGKWSLESGADNHHRIHGLPRMNRLHRWYCRSSRWKTTLETEILPWSLGGIELGNDVLEIGPGPGLTTDWLRHRCRSLTCLELDQNLAVSLERRTAALGVRVHCGSATAMPYDDCTFSDVVSFTMLHHVPSVVWQDQLFDEVHRVLKPGGTFVGVDSLGSWQMKLFHVRDTLILVDPVGLPGRLEAIGFADVSIETRNSRFRFVAHRPL